MPVDQKILDRIGKLLRLAAPTSGTTQGERESAAVEAAKLIHEHSLSVLEREPSKKERGRKTPDDRYTTRATVWVKWTINRGGTCRACELAISRGDVVLMRVCGEDIQLLHNYPPCNRNAC